MSGYALTPLAKADIFDIWSYIARDNEDAANRVEQAIYDACGFLADGPLRGHSRPDLTTRLLRFWTLTRYPNYTVAYRPESGTCERQASNVHLVVKSDDDSLGSRSRGQWVYSKRRSEFLCQRRLARFLGTRHTAASFFS
jgi:plasmid stabilization system protein ParE